MAKRPTRPRPTAGKVVKQAPKAPGSSCYLCGGAIGTGDRIVRTHETTMHRQCYERDIMRGR